MLAKDKEIAMWMVPCLFGFPDVVVLGRFHQTTSGGYPAAHHTPFLRQVANFALFTTSDCHRLYLVRHFVERL